MTLMFQYLAPDQHGDMAIAGRRLRVYTVRGEYEMGMSAESIAENADVPLAAVYEALAYAAEHREEMEAISRAEDESYVAWMNALPDERLREAAGDGLQTVKREYKEAVRKAKERRPSTPLP